MATVRRRNQPISTGYDVIYPPGCKEVNEDLRLDELKRRLNDLCHALIETADADNSHEASLLEDEDAVIKSRLESDRRKKFENLKGLTLHLSSNQFQQHEDLDVRLRVATCLCAVMKVFCPRNPFEEMLESRLLMKSLLQFILSCILHLSKIKSKTDPNYIHLYEIFSICCQLDLFIWCTAIDDGDRVLHEFFRTVFTVIKNVKVWAWMEEEKVFNLVLDMMSNLVGQTESLITHETVAYVLHFLIEPAKSTQPEQHQLARDLVLRTASHLEYHIQMLIQNSLVTSDSEPDDKAGKSSKATKPQRSKQQSTSAGTSHADNTPGSILTTRDEDISDDDEETTVSGEGGQGAGSAGGGDLLGDQTFRLIYTLHTLRDSLVTPILPTVEIKLKSKNPRDRIRACRLLAKLFSEPNSSVHTSQPALWEAFLGRFNDIQPDVRKICVQAGPQLLRTNPDLPRADIIGAFKQRVHDPDESVRQDALHAIATLVSSSLSQLPEDLFSILVERTRDKSLGIRKEVLTSLAGIYKAMAGSGLGGRDRMATTVNAILRMYYQESADDKLTVERLFKSTLVPYNLSPAERMKALIKCYDLLDEASIRAVQEMFKVQYTMMSLLREVLLLLTEHQGKQITGQLNKDVQDRMNKMAAYLPHGEKCMDHLRKFFNIIHTDKSLRQSLLKLTAPACSCSKAAEIMRDVLRKYGTGTGGSGEGGTSGGTSGPVFLHTVKALLERASPVLFDQTTGQELITHLVVSRESPTDPDNQIRLTRSLRLLFALTVFFKETLPTDEAMEYILSILKSHVEDGSTVETALPPPSNESTQASSSAASVVSGLGPIVQSEGDAETVEELGLQILCCLLGAIPGSSDLTTNAGPLAGAGTSATSVGKFSGSRTQLSKLASDLLPLLDRYCTTGITCAVPRSSQESGDLTSGKGRGRGRGGGQSKKAPVAGRGKKGGPDSASLVSNSQESEESTADREVNRTGLLWRLERRRAKFAVRCLHRLLVTVGAGERRQQEKDQEEGEGEGRSGQAGSLTANDDLESRIKAALDTVVKNCLACPVTSADYVTCLTTLSHISLLIPGVYNKQLKDVMTRDLFQNLLVKDPPDDGTVAVAVTKESAAEWLPDGLISQLTRAKIEAIKLLTRWLYGLKTDDKSLVQSVVRVLLRIIVNNGDLTKKGKIRGGEMSRLRLVAAGCWLKLAQLQSYVEVIEVSWYQSMALIISDPCEQVRTAFLNKLHRGLIRLRLPLEYLAILTYACDVPNPRFRQAARKFLQSNVARRREFLSRHPSWSTDAKLLFALLPDYVLSYVIHLLSHDPKWTVIDDPGTLTRMKNCLWFIMEPVVQRGENFSFLRKLIEKIKHTRDALCPDNELANQRLYTVCDIALGLLLTKSTAFMLKEYPVEVKLPRALFIAAPPNFVNPEFSQLSSPSNARAPLAKIQFTPPRNKTTECTLPAHLIKRKAHPSSVADDELTQKQGSVNLPSQSSSPNGKETTTDTADENVTLPTPAVPSPKKRTQVVLGEPEIESATTRKERPVARNIRVIKKKRKPTGPISSSPIRSPPTSPPSLMANTTSSRGRQRRPTSRLQELSAGGSPTSPAGKQASSVLPSANKRAKVVSPSPSPKKHAPVKRTAQVRMVSDQSELDEEEEETASPPRKRGRPSATDSPTKRPVVEKKNEKMKTKKDKDAPVPLRKGGQRVGATTSSRPNSRGSTSKVGNGVSIRSRREAGRAAIVDLYRISAAKSRSFQSGSPPT